MLCGELCLGDCRPGYVLAVIPKYRQDSSTRRLQRKLLGSHIGVADQKTTELTQEYSSACKILVICCILYPATSYVPVEICVIVWLATQVVTTQDA